MDIELATEQKLALKASIAVNKYLVDVGLAAGQDLESFAIRERYKNIFFRLIYYVKNVRF